MLKLSKKFAGTTIAFAMVLGACNQESPTKSDQHTKKDVAAATQRVAEHLIRSFRDDSIEVDLYVTSRDATKKVVVLQDDTFDTRKLNSLTGMGYVTYDPTSIPQLFLPPTTDDELLIESLLDLSVRLLTGDPDAEQELQRIMEKSMSTSRPMVSSYLMLESAFEHEVLTRPLDSLPSLSRNLKDGLLELLVRKDGFGQCYAFIDSASIYGIAYAFEFDCTNHALQRLSTTSRQRMTGSRRAIMRDRSTQWLEQTRIYRGNSGCYRATHPSIHPGNSSDPLDGVAITCTDRLKRAFARNESKRGKHMVSNTTSEN